jgi:hypothetical protein
MGDKVEEGIAAAFWLGLRGLLRDFGGHMGILIYNEAFLVTRGAAWRLDCRA